MRCRKVEVRFSEAELAAVRAAADGAGAALGGWIGEVAVRAAGHAGPAELASLLRLHVDVMAFAAHAGAGAAGRVEEPLGRLDAAVAAVTARASRR